MIQPSKGKPKRRSRRLYHSAKISDRQFREVLGHFVLDRSATETARETGLSINSVNAIFRKIRVYFFEVGLFRDPYDGEDPRAFKSDNIEFEFLLLEFHLNRYAKRRGLQSFWNEPDYHFAESVWRFEFAPLQEDRSGHVQAMMLNNLLEIIRLCGPIGSRPTNRRGGLMLVLRQMDQRLLWMERNAPGFRSPADRATLRDIRAIQPKSE